MACAMDMLSVFETGSSLHEEAEDTEFRCGGFGRLRVGENMELSFVEFDVNVLATICCSRIRTNAE